MHKVWKQDHWENCHCPLEVDFHSDDYEDEEGRWGPELGMELRMGFLAVLGAFLWFALLTLLFRCIQ